jgi:hypothetical protein
MIPQLASPDMGTRRTRFGTSSDVDHCPLPLFWCKIFKLNNLGPDLARMSVAKLRKVQGIWDRFSQNLGNRCFNAKSPAYAEASFCAYFYFREPRKDKCHLTEVYFER